MSSPHHVPSFEEAMAALRYTEDEKNKFTKTAITFIVAGIGFVIFAIAAWISGPAPLIPAMAELDEIQPGETYQAGDISLRLDEAYVQQTSFGDDVVMAFEVNLTNHASAPIIPTTATRPVYFSGLSWTVEEAVYSDFVPDRSAVLGDPGGARSINPGTSATVLYEFRLLPEEVEDVAAGSIRVYFMKTTLNTDPAAVLEPTWSEPAAAAYLVVPIEDRR